MLIRNKQLKQLLEQIQDDCNLLKDKLEIDILENYASNVRLFTQSVLGFCCIILFIFSTLQYLPFILHILPFNKSQSLQLLSFTEYLIIPDKYIYVMMLHEFLTIYVGLATVLGTGLTIMIYVVHICVLLKIASYRIENIIERNILVISSPRREHLVYRRIIHAIVIHQRAIEYHKFFMSVFLKPFGFLVIIGIGSIIFALFLFSQQMAANNKGMALASFALIQIYLIYLFVSNYGGQTVIDNGIIFSEAIYNGLWYAAPLSTQKLLLFVMQRGRAYLSLTFYNVIVASFDGFAMLMKMSVSYFMVLNSTQK
ncbi:uncharacterized protein LOC120359119 isoform X2 [Solenopsis invicta]|uniref:uncharacterized protein LOC120359119 isoform X1 n=1 Tax=Solenopsis invicta TaxID=13686 RepID=UPI00193D4671|nr:uncharacterized protein LOC120359119 isoform X1 [Solenopsis invicta]XP_039311509.1 uncharacterized protein LOC120359119 isoform X2 [Solenopsis invicta]